MSGELIVFLTAAAIAGGNAVSEEAITLMAKFLVPRWLYLMAGGRSWKKKAKTFGVQNKLDARPYVR